MACRVTVVPVVCADCRVDKIRVSVHPNHLQVFVHRIQSVDGSATDRVVSAYSNHDVVGVFLDPFEDGVIDAFQEGVKQGEILYKMGLLFIVFSYFNATSIDVAQIDHLHFILLFQSFQQTAVSQQLRGLFHSLDALSLPDLRTQV